MKRKQAEAGVLPQCKPEIESSFPKNGYSTNLSTCPKVTFGTIWRYMIDRVSTKKQIATAKPLVKGYNFFMSNHVLAMFHCKANGKHYIKSQVLPSMKKSTVYACFLVLSLSTHVVQSKCGCPAGVDGRCNHVAATLFALESLHKKGPQLHRKQQPQVMCLVHPSLAAGLFHAKERGLFSQLGQ